MKIKTKLIVFYIISIIIIFFSFIFISFFLKHNYIDIKYKNAKTYYDNNQVSIEEYSSYLIDKGFIVTKQEITPYKNKENLVCHLKQDEIVIYNDEDPILFAVINENIIKDTLFIINILLFVIFILISIISFILYKVIKKYFINRISILEENVNNFKLGEEFPVLDDSYGDEINRLEEKIKDMIFKLNIEEEQKIKFAFALSHDLKNPIMKIKAILSMHKKEVENYKEKDEVIALINYELNDLVEKINLLISFYKDKNFEDNKQSIDLIKAIKVSLKKEIPNLEVKGSKKEFLINADIKKVEIIVNNIVSNILKYSNQKDICINFKDDYIEISNDIVKSRLYKESGVGNIINDIFAKDIGLEIINKTIDKKYIIKIKDIS